MTIRITPSIEKKTKKKIRTVHEVIILRTEVLIAIEIGAILSMAPLDHRIDVFARLLRGFIYRRVLH